MLLPCLPQHSMQHSPHTSSNPRHHPLHHNPRVFLVVAFLPPISASGATASFLDLPPPQLSLIDQLDQLTLQTPPRQQHEQQQQDTGGRGTKIIVPLRLVRAACSMRCPCLLLPLLLSSHALLVETFLRVPSYQRPHQPQQLFIRHSTRVVLAEPEIPVVIPEPPPLPPLLSSLPEEELLSPPPPLPPAAATPIPKAPKIKNDVLLPPPSPPILRVHHDENILPTHPNETHVIIRRMSLK